MAWVPWHTTGLSFILPSRGRAWPGCLGTQQVSASSYLLVVEHGLSALAHNRPQLHRGLDQGRHFGYLISEISYHSLGELILCKFYILLILLGVESTYSHLNIYFDSYLVWRMQLKIIKG